MPRFSSLPQAAAAVALVAGLGSSHALAQTGEVYFANPMLAQVPVDQCVTYSAQCGQPAADLFCGTQGFAAARSWSLAEVPQTIVLGDLQRCVDASRDALVGVTCAAAPGAAGSFRSSCSGTAGGGTTA